MRRRTFQETKVKVSKFQGALELTNAMAEALNKVTARSDTAEETEPDHGNTQINGGFHLVTGNITRTARINGQDSLNMNSMLKYAANASD